MKKRGNLLTMQILVEVVIAVVLITTASLWVSSELSDSEFERNFFSRDIALISEISLGAPGVMNIEYKGSDRFEMDVEMQPGLVTVSDGERTSSAIFPINDIEIEENKI